MTARRVPMQSVPGADARPAKRLRVAVLNRQFLATGGGAERYSIALVEQLAAQHEMHVFAQRIDHHWPGVTYHTVSQALQRPRWINQLWYAVVTWWATRKGFDIVHSHENTWHGQVQTVHVLPIRYNLLHGLTGASRALRWLKIIASPRLLVYLALEAARFSLRHPRTLVLTSQTLVVQTLQAYPGCAPAIEVITPGVNQVAGRSSAAEQAAARAGLGLPTSGYGWLFVGNDYRKKGLDTLLRAFAKLPPTCFLIVVGNAAQVPEFKSQAQTLGVAERVFFLGALRDITPAYQAADSLLHPTREDTFAMVVLEAMAHGLPVILSGARYCGIADLLRDGRDALVLEDPFDVAALALTAQRLMASPALADALVTAGLAFASGHQWSALAQLQSAIYQRMAVSSL